MLPELLESDFDEDLFEDKKDDKKGDKNDVEKLESPLTELHVQCIKVRV